MGRGAVLLCVATMAQLQPQTAVAQQPLSDGETRTLIAGQSATYSNGGIAVYFTDGQYTYTGAGGRVVEGKWNVAGGRICYDFSNGGSRCDRVFKDPVGPYIVNTQGRLYRFETGPAEQPAVWRGATLSVCDQSAKYLVQAPTSDVGEHIRSYLGVWSGAWDNGPCAAFAVDAVQSNGNARVLYLSGASEAHAMKGGIRRYFGRISGETLRISAGGVSIEFSLTGAGKVSGVYKNGAGQLSGNFSHREL